MRSNLMPVTAPTCPLFLLSYSHAPTGSAEQGSKDTDYLVYQFFRDLCLALERLGATPRGGPLGIFDRHQWIGDDWVAGLPAALASSRVLVPLYSDRYFLSPHCGREWTVFATRPAAGAPPIIPVLWEPMTSGELPPAARSVPVEFDGLASYEKIGLGQLQQNSRYRADYTIAVGRLARKILSAAAIAPVGPWPAVNYSTLPSAFAPAPGPVAGERRLRVTIAAPNLGVLPDGRGARAYGATAMGWTPYWAQSALPIADQAANLARSGLGYRTDVGDLKEHAADLLAAGPVGLQLLIIDPWLLTDPDQANLFARFRLADKPWVAVVVPWSAADAESAAARGRLREAVDRVLGDKRQGSLGAHGISLDQVPSSEAFDLAVPPLVRRTATRLPRFIHVCLPAGSAAPTPSLHGFAQRPPNFLERAGE